MKTLQTLCYLSIVWCINYAISEKLSSFSLQAGMLDRSCVYWHEDFTTPYVTSKMWCAVHCKRSADCAGFFYSFTAQQCVGCKALYSSSSGLGFMIANVYFTRKWHTEYLGCFEDCLVGDPCRRLMHHRLVDDHMTMELCRDYCLPTYGLRYFGLQDGHSCFCGDGNYYYIDGPANITSCDKPCWGNSSQTCGGWSSNSVYRYVFE